jgi:hypothetical protein
VNLASLKRPKAAYVEYRPKAIGKIIWETDHTKGRSHMSGRLKEGNLGNEYGWYII